MKRLNHFIRNIRDILWTNNRFQYKVVIIPNNPNYNTLKDDIIYIVGTKHYAKWAYLKCPCGCGATIMLSLNKETYPSWTIKQDGLGRASIFPSINKLDGCKSHFFIRKGRLIWATFNTIK